MDALRSLVWIAAAAGVLMAFAWPFAVSPDPDDPLLHAVAIATVIVLLAAITAAAVLKARAPWRRGPD